MEIKKFKNVTELNKKIRKLVDDFSAGSIEVTGELSNLKISNNNLFATLKDNNACIGIVNWKYGYRRDNLNLSNGDNIKVIGKLTQYMKSGNVNFVVYDIEKIEGIGDLHKQYEELKNKYEKLGYFTNKKKYPENIKNIGIITALKGAALQDMLYLLKKNSYFGNIYIKGCYVQGNNCPKSVSDNIKLLENWTNESKEKLDVIVITRGGGSLEDLNGFSSPLIIEAIHNCSIFTISAIGHEIDFMLSDFVADLRAPTPSIAAEMICEIQKNKLEDYNQINQFIFGNMINNIKTTIYDLNIKLNKIKSCIISPEKRLDNEINELLAIKKIIYDNMHISLEELKNKLNNCNEKLYVYDIKNMMEKGYCIVQKHNKVIDSIKNIEKDQVLRIQMKDGELLVKVC